MKIDIIYPPYPFLHLHDSVGKIQSKLQRDGKDGKWWNVMMNDQPSIPSTSESMNSFTIDTSKKDKNKLKRSATSSPIDDNNSSYGDEIILNPEWTKHFDRMLRDYDVKKRQRLKRCRKR